MRWWRHMEMSAGCWMLSARCSFSGKEMRLSEISSCQHAWRIYLTSYSSSKSGLVLSHCYQNQENIMQSLLRQSLLQSLHFCICHKDNLNKLPDSYWHHFPAEILGNTNILFVSRWPGDNSNIGAWIDE